MKKTILYFLLIIPFLFCCSGKKNKKLSIAVIPMGTTHEFWKSIHAGAETAGKELGVDIIWKGPLKEDDRDEQIKIVETFVASHVDAIVLTPLDDRALIRPVKEAKNLGIPTVIYNSILQGNEHIAYVSTDNYKGGVLAAEYMGKIMGGKGKIIMVRVLEGSNSSTLRENGFIETIKSKFPEMTILSDNQYTGVTTETAYRTCENVLNRFPDVEGFFAPNESSTFGCLRAFQDRGLAGKIKFIGFDSSDKLIEALGKSEIVGLIVQNPFKMGYESVQIAVKHLKGESYPKETDTGVTLVTPENMNEPEIKKLLKPDLSILNQ